MTQNKREMMEDVVSHLVKLVKLADVPSQMIAAMALISGGELEVKDNGEDTLMFTIKNEGITVSPGAAMYILASLPLMEDPIMNNPEELNKFFDKTGVNKLAVLLEKTKFSYVEYRTLINSVPVPGDTKGHTFH